MENLPNSFLKKARLFEVPQWWMLIYFFGSCNIAPIHSLILVYIVCPNFIQMLNGGWKIVYMIIGDGMSALRAEKWYAFINFIKPLSVCVAVIVILKYAFLFSHQTFMSYYEYFFHLINNHFSSACGNLFKARFHKLVRTSNVYETSHIMIVNDCVRQNCHTCSCHQY